MKPKWVIETEIFPEDENIFKALDKLHIEYKLYNINDCSMVYPDEDCVIFYGSLNTAKKLIKKSKWIPGVYYNIPRYECRYYYAHLGKYLLNSNYIFIPFSELPRQKEFLYEHLGYDRTIFIRPDRADKPFTGTLVYKEHFDSKLDKLYNRIKPEDLIVVSEPRNIKFEWRFVVVNGKIIAGSQYKENDKIRFVSEYPKEAFDFASYIASIYHPDVCWVCDICQTKHDEFKIMEVGCFSCAGLYKCDLEIVVKAVSEAAISEWESYQI